MGTTPILIYLLFAHVYYFKEAVLLEDLFACDRRG